MASKREGISVGAAVAIGLGVASMAGILAYLILRKSGPAGLSGAPPIYILNQHGGGHPMLPFPAGGGFMDPAKTFSDESRVRTITLPQSGQTVRPVMIAKGYGYEKNRIELNVIGPPGQFAILSFDIADLMVSNALPTQGDTLVIAAGFEKVVWIKPGQYLYGVGSTANVVLSVSTSYGIGVS